MITRIGKNLALHPGGAPDAAQAIERNGYTLLRGVFGPDEVADLADDMERIYAELPPDVRIRVTDRSQFRYEMYNRSAVTQRAIAHPRILEVVDAVLGQDCHVIANTCWRNPPNHRGGGWHCDAGPHVPRPDGVPWDDRIPYPIFVIGAHLWLRDVAAADGPTAVIPTSHRSGRLPPRDQLGDAALSYDGVEPVAPEAKAGDVLMFSSDIWHRGLPAGDGGRGRLFIQCHYGRRDIAQRVRTAEQVNQVCDEARARIESDRERDLLGLHPPYFYDG